MSLSVSSSFSSSFARTIEVGSKTLSAPLQKPDVEAEFLKEARKTPAERLHEALLKKLGLTEEEFAALDPQAKAAVEEAIKEEIVKQAQAKSEKSLGLFTDVSV